LVIVDRLTGEVRPAQIFVADPMLKGRIAEPQVDPRSGRRRRGGGAIERLGPTIARPGAQNACQAGLLAHADASARRVP
jgi:hypothetical protein